ncbi:MAG: hypothetical protein KBH06_11725 [Spirochaetes bacterium]|nr:hypothetical protein [Spirochaetota bacterium]
MKLVRVIIAPFAFFSGLAFVLSFISFLIMISKISFTVTDNYCKYLLFAFYVLWVPAIIMSNVTARNHVRKDFWKVVLWASPKWMKILPIVLFVVSLLFYLLSFLDVISFNYENSGYGYLSLFLMAGYSSAFAIFYSPVKEGRLIISKEDYDKKKD